MMKCQKAGAYPQNFRSVIIVFGHLLSYISESTRNFAIMHDHLILSICYHYQYLTPQPECTIAEKIISSAVFVKNTGCSLHRVMKEE